MASAWKTNKQLFSNTTSLVKYKNVKQTNGGREINISMRGEKRTRAINCSRERENKRCEEERTARDRKERGWLVGCYSLGREVTSYMG